MATLTDDFNRADAANLGAGWTGDTSVDALPAIASNKAEGRGSGGNVTSDVRTETFDNDQSASAVVAGDLADACWVGLFVRATATRNGGYLVIYYNTGAHVHVMILFKRTGGGTFVQLGATYTLPGNILAAGDVIKLSAVGTTLDVFINGVSQGTRTDSLFTSGVPGIAFAGNGVNVNLDNFVATGLQARARFSGVVVA